MRVTVFKSFLTILLVIGTIGFLNDGCSRGSQKQQVDPVLKGGEEPAVEEPAALVPFFDALLSLEQRADRSEKYRAIFTNENVLNALSLDRVTSFKDWEGEKQHALLETIIFYEENGGTAVPPFTGNCSMTGGANPCFQLHNLRVTQMVFIPSFAEYLYLTHAAWNLYVEANHLVPWSILNYSVENLKILFYSISSQPPLNRQSFGSTLNVVEDYQIVLGLLREAGEERMNLVANDSRDTILNLTRFVGRRVAHFRGSADNRMGPQSPIWPYRLRNAGGEAMADANGVRLPLPWLPTPREILVLRDPHHDIQRNPDAVFGPQYHLVNGCWGASQLIKSLLQSVNLPVRLEGDYFNFGGHSGISFLETAGEEYHLHHADNLFHFPWAYGLLNVLEPIPGEELWNVENFSPFGEYLSGYSVLHSRKLPNAIAIDPALQVLYNQQLGEGFGGSQDYDLRILGLRAGSNPKAVQTLYSRCAGPGLERRHLPLNYLTDAEEAKFMDAADEEINRRRQEAGGNPSCFELFFEDLNRLYKLKTGLELRDDADGDGFENYRDCNVYKRDNGPCEEKFVESLAISVVG